MKFLLVFTALIAVSCSDDFLDLTPISSKSVDGLLLTEEGFDQAVIGAYDGLQDVLVTNNYAAILSEDRSDNTFQLTVTSSNNDLSVSQFLVSSSNPLLSSVWTQLYSTITRCNNVLVNIENIDIEANKRSQYIGEMKFIRALMYFELVRYFGGVPITTSLLSIEESLQLPRSSTEEVYGLIISDLDDAIVNLPNAYSGGEVGRATSYSARGLLGKVYLTRSGFPLQTNEWELAKSLFEEVIQSGNFELYDNYAEIFSDANDNGSESVFSVQFKAGVDGEGNPNPTLNAPNFIDKEDPLGLPFGGNPLSMWVSNDLINSFENGDLRLTQTVREEWLHTDGTLRSDQLWFQKFAFGTPVNAFDWDVNWPVIRYTDILMMYAEVLNEIGYTPNGEAFDILNDIRNRAGVPPMSSAEVPDQEAFRLWVEQERRHELAFENHRWHDLVRTDRAIDVMKTFLANFGMESNLKSKDQYIYPIPLREMLVNPNLSQNPGYE